MKRFTLPDFFNFFRFRHLVLESNEETSFKQDFSKNRLEGNVDSNQSSSRGIGSLILLFLLFLFSNFLFAQNPGTSLSQGQNGSLNDVLNPMAWRNGNLNPQQSHYIEGHSIPYRILMINMPINQEVELVIGYDLVNGSKYAIDFITDFQQLDPHNFTSHGSEEIVNPLLPNPLVAPTSTLPITLPSYLLAANDGIFGVANARAEFLALQANNKAKMSIWGATFDQGFGVQYNYFENSTSINAAQALDLSRGETKVQFRIKFTPTQSSVTLAWGGHIALRNDWGISPIQSAGGISGSPYHMRTIDWNLGNLGNEDRSLQIALAAPICPSEFPGTPGSLCTDSSFLPIPCPVQVCSGTTQYFSVPVSSGASGYSWTLNSGTSGATFVGGINNTQNVSVVTTSAGTYTVSVTLTNSSGINTVCSETINVQQSVCEITGNNVICAGDSTSFTASAEGTSYSWTGPGGFTANTASTGPISVAGQYDLTVTTNGCISVCSRILTVNPPPAITCPSPASVGVECGLNLTAAQGAANAAFTTWFDAFSTNNTFESVAVTYVYSPTSAAPVSGMGAPKILPGFGTTSVLVTWTITDANGCKNSCSQTFNLDYACNISCNTVATDLSCNQPNSGLVKVTANNGTRPYNFYLYKLPDTTTPVASILGVDTEPGEHTFSGLGAGDYLVTSTDALTEIADAANCGSVTVKAAPTPVCSITGTDVPVCPNSSNNYSGPDGIGYTYEWSITGNGSIPANSIGQTVSVTATTCGDYTLSLKVTNAEGCFSTCDKKVFVVDTEKPVIATTAQSGDLGCNPTVTAPIFTGLDNCDGVFTPRVTTDGAQLTSGDSECMTYSQTWTANFTDACLNDAVPVSITYTWKVDTEEPVIVAEDYIICEGTLPVTLTATWTDNCSAGGELTAIGVPGVSTSCTTSNTYTFKVMDDCGNIGTKTITVTRETDTYANCNTAFGKLDSGSLCFLDDSKIKNNRWGWTNNITEEGIYNMPLYAGAAGCDITNKVPVGNAQVTYLLGKVSVVYTVNPGYVMNEAHVNVSCTKYPMVKGKPTVAPGQYNFNASNLDKVAGLTVNFTGTVSGPIWVIVHAVICEETCHCSQLIHGSPVYNNVALNLACPVPATVGSTAVEPALMEVAKVSETSKVGFEAYPVPFKDVLTIKYKFDYSSDVKIEVFNSNGILVLSKVDSNGYLNNETTLTLNSNKEQEQVYVVKVTTNRGSSVKKIMSSK